MFLRMILLLLIGSSMVQAQPPVLPNPDPYSPTANPYTPYVNPYTPYVNPYTPGLSPYNPGIAAASPFGYQQNYYNPTYQTVSPTLSLFLGGSPPLTNYAAPQALANRNRGGVAVQPFPIGALSPLRYGFLNLSGVPSGGAFSIPQGGADVPFLISTGRPASFQGFRQPGLIAPPPTRNPFAGSVTPYTLTTQPPKK